MNFSQFYKLTMLFFTVLLPSLAQADLSSDIRHFVEEYTATGGAQLVNTPLNNPTLVTEFYQTHQHQPIWITEINAKRLRELIDEINRSQQHGFKVENYHLTVLSDEHQPDFVREILATDAFLTQVQHRSLGVISTFNDDPDWFLPVKFSDPISLLNQVVIDNKVTFHLHSLWPENDEYWLLLEKRKALLVQDSVIRVEVPAGRSMKKGEQSERIILLKNRLLGPGEYNAIFDNELELAVKAFQLASGLDTDGIVGSSTIEVLNASSFSWIDRIDANLERWRWLPNSLPSTYVRVNIAAFNLRVMKDDIEQLKMNVIVGKPYRKTPIFTETMKYIVVNPYWNVPYKLATQDKLPVLKKDTKSLETLGFEAKSSESNTFVSVSDIDWEKVTARQFNYVLRQKPGPKNALGTMKFMLPNPHSIYLHDTPDHALFSKQERSFSSGCVRLSEPALLAEWVLNNDLQPQKMNEVNQALTGTDTKTIYLKTPLPVMMVYFTAFKDEHNEVIFRRDIYNRDQSLITALRE
jgi:murein L,D-transpeptidase YcbB/YkuD